MSAQWTRRITHSSTLLRIFAHRWLPVSTLMWDIKTSSDVRTEINWTELKWTCTTSEHKCETFYVYWDKCVCLSVRSRYSKTTRLNFTKFLMHVARARGRCSVVNPPLTALQYTSGFVDDVGFLHHGPMVRHVVLAIEHDKIPTTFCSTTKTGSMQL